MIGIFKQKNPANILFLMVFGIAIKFPMFMHPHAVQAGPDDSSLYRSLLNGIISRAHGFPMLFPLLAFILLFIQSVLLARFLNNQRMMSPPNSLPGMAYLLITSLSPEWNYFSAPLIVNTILLFVFSGLFRIYNQPRARATIYNIGLALGLASFLFVPSLIFITWVFLALMVMRPFRLNEWVLFIVGMATPSYFFGVYLFITGQWDWQTLWPSFHLALPNIQQTAWIAGSAFLLAVPLLIGGYYVQDSLRRMLIQVRKGWSLLLLYLLSAVLVPFVNGNGNLENWVMITIPFAAFHSYTYFYSRRRIIPLLVFWLTVAFVVGYQYWGPRWN